MQDNAQLCLTNQQFMTVVEAIESATSIKDLFDKIFPAMNAKVGSYHHLSDFGSSDSQKFSRYHNYNLPTQVSDFYDLYEANNSQRKNPGVTVAFTRGEFIWLSDLEKDPYIINASYAQQVRHGMEVVKDGLCVPLLASKHRYGYAFVGFGCLKEGAAPIFPFQIQALMQKFHIKYCDFIEGLSEKIKLTSRELQVLENISFGKTNVEIAAILGISANTVNGYVSTVFLKLDVTDRVSAAIMYRRLASGV